MAKTVKTATRRIRRHSQPAFSQFPLLNDVQEHSVCITDARHKNRDGRLNPVPFVVCCDGVELREGGRLSDIAPTMLDIMNIEKPDVMSGSSLIIK